MITFIVCHSEGTMTREPEQRKKKCVTFNKGKNYSICPTFPEEEGIRKSKDFSSQNGVRKTSINQALSSVKYFCQNIAYFILMLISVQALNKWENIFTQHMSSIVTLQQIGLSEIQILLEFMTNALYFVPHIANTSHCHKNEIMSQKTLINYFH